MKPVFVWSPTINHRLGRRVRARDAALLAVRITTTEEERTTPMEAFLRQSTWKTAFDKWESEWLARLPHESSIHVRHFISGSPSSANHILAMSRRCQRA